MPPMKLVGSVSEPRLVGADAPTRPAQPFQVCLVLDRLLRDLALGIVAAVQVDLGVRSGEAHRVADDLRVVVAQYTLGRLEDSGVRALCGRVREDDEVTRGDGRRRTGDCHRLHERRSGRRRDRHDPELLARLPDEHDVARAEVRALARRDVHGRRHVGERARVLRGTREVLILEPVDLDLLGRACEGSLLRIVMNWDVSVSSMAIRSAMSTGFSSARRSSVSTMPDVVATAISFLSVDGTNGGVSVLRPALDAIRLQDLIDTVQIHGATRVPQGDLAGCRFGLCNRPATGRGNLGLLPHASRFL